MEKRKAGRPRKLPYVLATCSKHGVVDHQVPYEGAKPRCAKCAVDKSSAYYNANLQESIDYCGGCCFVCGKEYLNCQYDFHHLDPVTKKLDISKLLFCHPKNWETKVKPELDKCVMTCANCHRLFIAKKVLVLL